MGRPVEVENDEIIAAALRLEERGIAVKATRLWTAVGGRGRPDRMLDIWHEFSANRIPVATVNPRERPLLPERAVRLTASLKISLGNELDRVVDAIYDEVQTTLTARYQSEFTQMQTATAECASETQEALEALGKLSDARQHLEESARLSGRELAAARRECDIKDQMMERAASSYLNLAVEVSRLRDLIETQQIRHASWESALTHTDKKIRDPIEDLALANGEVIRDQPESRRFESEPIRSGLCAHGHGDKVVRLQSRIPPGSADRKLEMSVGPAMKIRTPGSKSVLRVPKGSLGDAPSMDTARTRQPARQSHATHHAAMSAGHQQRIVSELAVPFDPSSGPTSPGAPS